MTEARARRCFTDEQKKRKLEYGYKWACEHPDRAKEIGKKYRDSHPGKATDRMIKWRAKNKDYVLDKSRKRYRENPDRYREAVKRYRSNHPEKIAKYQKEYQKEWIKNPTHHLISCLRKRMQKLLRGSKSKLTMDLIGCSMEYLKAYIEDRFRPGMTWENYGKVWHIDHVNSIASYGERITEPFVQLEVFNFKNLQPLFCKENISKGARCGVAGPTWGGAA